MVFHIHRVRTQNAQLKKTYWRSPKKIIKEMNRQPNTIQMWLRRLKLYAEYTNKAQSIGIL